MAVERNDVRSEDRRPQAVASDQASFPMTHGTHTIAVPLGTGCLFWMNFASLDWMHRLVLPTYLLLLAWHADAGMLHLLAFRASLEHKATKD
uniref:Uncharacterized protein n=4 Tax=Oryza TaxID=4527 RepID=Q10D50_ORYSJ|nr:hypothetical protein [Oryza sativa Japonica Group]AAR87292.1 hypothetical protein [Oryza sativa Japonica Group]ABF98791.1 hypothetical protein LOC_Os03g52990 [Oryza sativa Japonica Group]